MPVATWVDFLIETSRKGEGCDSRALCASGDDMQWGEPRPRHMREPKTRAPEDSLQVGDTPTHILSQMHIQGLCR